MSQTTTAFWLVIDKNNLQKELKNIIVLLLIIRYYFYTVCLRRLKMLFSCWNM